MKMKRKITALALSAALMMPAALNAQELETWGSVAGWDILIDHSIGSGRLIQAAYEDGSVVRIGFDRVAGDGYVTALNESWGAIEEGAMYPITFELDGASYDGEAKGIYLNGVPGADIHFSNPDFLFDLAKKYTMTLYHDGSEVMSINLDGSYVGLEAVMECQDEMG
jgi:hypothetical protein